jgi:hypothetical protein
VDQYINFGIQRKTRQRVKWARRLFKEIIAKAFTNHCRNMDTQVHEA